MVNLENSLKETLKGLERLKQDIMMNINEMGANEQAITRTTVYPMAKVKPLLINGYPVFQFSYDGMLPHYLQDDFEYKNMIQHYYFDATLHSYDFSTLELPVFEKATIVFVQYFENNIIRDLDNRHKKHIQDAIRMTRLIKDDRWQNIWNVDIGFLDRGKSHVQVYVVSSKNMGDFLDYLIKNHEELKDANKDITLDISEYKKKYEKEQKAIESSQKKKKTKPKIEQKMHKADLKTLEDDEVTDVKNWW